MLSLKLAGGFPLDNGLGVPGMSSREVWESCNGVEGLLGVPGSYEKFMKVLLREYNVGVSLEMLCDEQLDEVAWRYWSNLCYVMKVIPVFQRAMEVTRELCLGRMIMWCDDVGKGWSLLRVKDVSFYSREIGGPLEFGELHWNKVVHVQKRYDVDVFLQKAGSLKSEHLSLSDNLSLNDNGSFDERLSVLGDDEYLVRPEYVCFLVHVLATNKRTDFQHVYFGEVLKGKTRFGAYKFAEQDEVLSFFIQELYS